MSKQIQNQTPNWRARIFIVGGAVGTLLGVVSAYLYARAVEEEAEKNRGEIKPIATRDMLGLSVALIGLIRIITELGSSDKKKK